MKNRPIKIDKWGEGLLRISQYGDDLWQEDFEPNGANR